MTPLSEFEAKAYALERTFGFYDQLREQGKSRTNAIDYTCLRFGIARFKFVALLNDRDAGYIGGSSE